MIHAVDPLIATIVLYFVATLLIAWWFGRDADARYVEFSLAGKNLGLVSFTMTYFATFVGGGLTMGIAQTAFLGGISAQWYAMTQGIAWITISLFIGYLYAIDVISVPELLGRVFGANSKYYEDTGEVELRMNGKTVATVDDQEDVFGDPTVYPATEKDISDFSEWTTIKRPALPSRIDRDMVDVLAVTDDGLVVLEPSGDRTPIAGLLEENDESESDGKISVSDLRR